MRGSPARNGLTAPRFTLDDEEGEEQEQLDQGAPSHRPQAVFNLDIDYDGDGDMLLDWQHYSRARRVSCCGLECNLNPLPEWIGRCNQRQRRHIAAAVLCLGLITFVMLATSVAAAFGGQRGRGAQAAAVAAQQACHWEEWRLPDVAAPHRYNLTLAVQMKFPWNVEGSVAMELNITSPTSCLVLHAASMQLTGVRMGGPDGAEASYREEAERQQLVLLWEEVLQPGALALYITFQYQLSEGMAGFYRSRHTLQDGTQLNLATTQLEANSARMMFPCFDEPAMKAVFNVAINTEKGLQVLSNMPARAKHHHKEHDEGVMTWHFKPTPPMSTYLLAVVIGNLSSVERSIPPAVLSAPPAPTIPQSEGPSDQPPQSPPPSGESRPLRIWGTSDQVANLEYAADVAAAILPAYEAAFGVPYPLPKLDLVAIPDFAAGAMENWGLITYRQVALLVSPTSSLVDRRYVVKVVAHEMAHQWFGNLVTMSWWGELWLNEGFASYLEYLGANAAHPELTFFETFYADDVPFAQFFDSKKASHPLSVLHGINSTARIEGMFDAVEYEAGAATLRMLRAWLNRGAAVNQTVMFGRAGFWEARLDSTPANDPFLAGIQRYLQQHQYGSTTAADLWAAMSDATGMELAPLMHDWTYNQGYPLLSVTTDSRGGVWVAQAPFSLQGASPCDSTDAWWVPVPFASSDAPAQIKWAEINACQSLRPLTTLAKGGWIKINARQYGYFRVNYTEEMWAALAAAAAQVDENSFPLLPAVDLAGLLEDSYSLAEAGSLNITLFLEMFTALQSRPAGDYAPWAAALPYTYAIARLAPCTKQWSSYLGQTMLPTFMQQAATPSVGVPGAAPVVFSFVGNATGGAPGEVGMGVRLLRPAVLKAAGFFGNARLQEEAVQILKSVHSGKAQDLDPDLRSTVYQTAARAWSSKNTSFKRLREIYVQARDADEKERALQALAHSPLAAPDALNFALTSDVRAQDVKGVVVTVAVQGDAVAVAATWEWVKVNWGALHAKLGAERSMLEEVDALFAEKQGEVDNASYAERAKESIEANAAWVERHGKDLCSWVEAQAGR